MHPAISMRRLGLRDAEEVGVFLQSAAVQIISPGSLSSLELENIRSLLSGDRAGAVDFFRAVMSGTAERAAWVGCVWLQAMETSSPAVGICLAKSRQNQPTLRLLLGYAIDEAVLQRKQEIRLAIVRNDGSAISLCQSMGFAEAGEAVQEGKAWLAMRKALAASPAERAAIIRRRLAGKRIAVVPYSHSDWAWGHTRNWHEHRYALVYGEVLQLLRADSSFRWYFDNYACQLSALLTLRPDLLPELRSQIHAGRIAICGGYVNVRPNMVEAETLVRNLVFGRRAFGELFPEADLSVHADCVDVAVGHPQLPQVLRQAGYRYLRLWRPDAALSLKGVPNEFYWRGLDGTEILVSRGFCAGVGAATDASRTLTADQRKLREPAAVDWDQVVNALWDVVGGLAERVRHCESDQLWLSFGSDDARPCRMSDDTPVDLFALLQQWNECEEAPMRFATPVDFFAELEKEGERLPRLEGTLDPCDVCFNVAWNGERGLAVRRVQNDQLLVQAEIFSVLAEDKGLTYPEERLDALWIDHLLTCAHATQWLYTEDFARMSRIADRVQLHGEEIRDMALDRLVRSMDLPEDVHEVVFNPLPFARRMPVITTLSKHGEAWPYMLADSRGRLLLTQVLRDYAGQGVYPEQQVLALIDLPALGYAAIRRVPGMAVQTRQVSPSVPVLDNGRLRVTVEADRITAVEDHTLGRVWRAPEGEEWGGLYLYDVDVRGGPLFVGPLTGEATPSWESAAIAEYGPVRWCYRRCGTIGRHRVVLDVCLYADEPRLDFELTVDWQGHDGFLAMRIPLLKKGRLYGDIPFGVEGKDLDREPYGKDAYVSPHSIERCREGLFYARSFVACDGPDGSGVAFAARNTDRFYISSGRRDHLEHVLINSVATLVEEWQENVEPSTLQGHGVHRFSCSCLFYTGNWQEADMVRQAASLRHHASVRRIRRDASPAQPRLRPEGAFVSVDPEHVMLSALYQERGLLYLRVYETLGKAAAARIQLGWPVEEAVAVDLTGAVDPTTLVSCLGTSLTVGLRPWQVCTIRARKER